MYHPMPSIIRYLFTFQILKREILLGVVLLKSFSLATGPCMCLLSYRQHYFLSQQYIATVFRVTLALYNKANSSPLGFQLFMLTKHTALLLLPQHLSTLSDLGITSPDVTQWRKILEEELVNGEDFIHSRA